VHGLHVPEVPYISVGNNRHRDAVLYGLYGVVIDRLVALVRGAPVDRDPGRAGGLGLLAQVYGPPKVLVDPAK
jgi:hypothetical protein